MVSGARGSKSTSSYLSGNLVQPVFPTGQGVGQQRHLLLGGKRDVASHYVEQELRAAALPGAYALGEDDRCPIIKRP